MTFTLRAARLDDLPAIAAADPRGDDPARARQAAEFVALGHSWVAIADDVVVGFAWVSQHFFGYPFVDLLVVAEPHRRRGAGSALMRACEGAHDRDRIFTSTNESNAPMRALMAAEGWQVSGVIENLDPGDPEIVYVKFRAAGDVV